MHSFFIVPFVIIATACSADAQWFNPPGTQSTESKIFYGDTLLNPLIRTDIPEDAYIAYTKGDSIMALYEKSSYTGNLPDSIRLAKLRFLSRYEYAITEYDAFLRRHSGRFYPYYLQDKIWSNIDEFGRDFALLVNADYIVKVRINHVAEGIDSTYGSLDYQKQPNVNAACNVLEIIKGRYLPQNCFTLLELQQNSSPCLKFGFRPTGRTFLVEPSDTPSWRGRRKNVKQGEIYYVFLELGSISREIMGGNYDALHPISAFDLSGGLFRVINGRVEDPSNISGAGMYPTEEEFRRNLFKKINTLKNFTAPEISN